MNEAPKNAEKPEFADISNGAARKVQQRGLRRAIAINAVVMAREHAERNDEPFTQSDADVIMYITELLDKVAG
jgi:hypothetical protein